MHDTPRLVPVLCTACAGRGHFGQLACEACQERGTQARPLAPDSDVAALLRLGEARLTRARREAAWEQAPGGRRDLTSPEAEAWAEAWRAEEEAVAAAVARSTRTGRASDGT